MPPERTEEEFFARFIGFIESQDRWFGGGIREIVDGYNIKADGARGAPMEAESGGGDL